MTRKLVRYVQDVSSSRRCIWDRSGYVSAEVESRVAELTLEELPLRALWASTQRTHSDLADVLGVGQERPRVMARESLQHSTRKPTTSNARPALGY